MRVWDLPTRVVHWSLVLLLAASWWTAESGALQWHRYSGYMIVGLLAFRIYWAFAGGATARLFGYLRGPRAFADYAKRLFERTGNGSTRAGHNPLGAWSALLLFTLLVMQTVLGAFAVDVDGIESGPLSHLVSFDAGRAYAELHHDLFDLLVVLVSLHIAAVLFYLTWRRENLIAPMITGERRIDRDVQPALHPSFPRGREFILRFSVGVAFATLTAWAFARGFWS